jgi:basic amino acid/polyamine antiporter, APA family
VSPNDDGDSLASPENQRKTLGFWPLFALGVNGIVGVGIFFTPASVAREAPGWSSVFVFAAVALGLAPIALAFAKLAARFDEDGGPVVYARAAFGETAGFLVGWVAYISAIASTAAVMAGLSRAVFGEEQQQLAAAVCATVLAAITAVGLSLSASVWSFLTIAKILPLLMLVTAGLAAGGFTVHPVLPEPGDGPAPSLLRAGLVAVFAYQGFEIVPVVAGQTAFAKRRVPAALLAALATAALLYVGLQAVAVRTLPALAIAKAPLAEAGAVLGGPGFGRMIGTATSVSALGIAVGMMAMTPRYLASAWPSILAVGGGDRLRLAEMSATGVPRRALLLTYALVLLLVTQSSLGQLLELSSVAVLTQYGATSVSLLALAVRGAHGLTLRDAWVVPPALVVTLGLVSQASLRELGVALGCLAVGVVLRFLHRAASPNKSDARLDRS